MASATRTRRTRAIDRRRYRRVRRFFFRVAVHVFWWDVLLNRPLLQRFRKPSPPRWGKLAREFAALAVEQGGVLIKLGQYLRTRIDLLPREVTSELATLQDRVPPEPYAAILAEVERAFGRPVDEVFAEFSPEVLGAASLAQAHRALLPDGTPVAVKVLRPGIERLVESDLAAIDRFLRRLKHLQRVRRQLDVDRAAQEFVTVTRRELDLEAEGRSAERFAADFARDPAIAVPRIHWRYTTPTVLTMEDVSSLQILDLEGLATAGIDRAEVARRLFNNYLDQFFVTSFVHADPHPGNLFVRPLPHHAEARLPGSFGSSFGRGRPFQIVFVDFGMVVDIPQRLRRPLRKYAIGIGTRDARAIVEAYVEAGVLQPEADLQRIERMTADILDQFFGSLLGQMRGEDLRTYAEFIARDYRDLIYESHFVIQAELLFVFRAMGILSGLISSLEPDLDLAGETLALARRLLERELLEGMDWQRLLFDAARLGPALLRLPRTLAEVARLAERGELRLDSAAVARTDRRLAALERSVDRLTWVMVAVGLAVSGTLWYVGAAVANSLAGAALPGGAVGLPLLAGGAGALLWGLLGRGRSRPR
jgi:predicted unusual protein kinase regulating ubiquinone biosynthesis (AarF/ABC1/UbiB family)